MILEKLMSRFINTKDEYYRWMDSYIRGVYDGVEAAETILSKETKSTLHVEMPSRYEFLKKFSETILKEEHRSYKRKQWQSAIDELLQEYKGKDQQPAEVRNGKL